MKIGVPLPVALLFAFGSLIGASCSAGEPGAAAPPQHRPAPRPETGISREASTGLAPGAPSPVPQDGPTDPPKVLDVRVLALDHRFEPATIKAKPGAVVRFTVVNQGQAPHTFTLRLGPQEIDLSLEAGESQRTQALTLPLEGPGPQTLPLTVPFRCRWHGSSDFKLGMVGGIQLARSGDG